MTRIIHLSDLHFGTEKKGIVEVLIDDVQSLNPDIVVISGDFTQRALRNQFIAAQNFIGNFDKENLICVPGNHDISLHNLFERFVLPFAKYQIYISTILNPEYSKDKIAIAGVNSVTPFKAMSGIVRDVQLENVSKFFKSQSQEAIKIVVMHHNLIKSLRHRIIDHAEKILTHFAADKVNLILSGHLHYAYLEQIKRDSFTHFMYVITAGTATSTRLGDYQNSFNVIDIDSNQFSLGIREFNGEKFVTLQENIFPLT